ncbi:MAG: hypothetical protein KGJ02_04420 [Verrucomicrobiota bacterium]|nr:hypothetical protein [Verrucomicrobiota bacterium]
MFFRIALLLLILPLTALRAAGEIDFETALKSFLELLAKEGSEQGDEFTKTSHTIHLKNEKLSYTAITGKLPQYAVNGEEVGELFFTAYLQDPSDSNRPVTFVFNGGPGGSSLPLHIASIGPRRLLLPEEGQKTLPPYEMIDNPETLLDVTDIVLIDPIGTGYSRANKEAYKSLYYSVEGDLASFSEFIRMFCITFKRWNSPKYLMGISYGTCRACGLAETLRAAWGIHLNGVILMSPALDFQTLGFIGVQRDRPLNDCLSIPTFAATAWYHGRTMQDKTIEETVDYARRFMYEQYLPVMMQPSRLNNDERKAFYQSLADLIGLPLSTIQRYEGRLSERIYTTEFLASDRKVIGGIDSRYIGDVSTLQGEFHEDPSYRDFRPALYPSFLNYMQTELETDVPTHYFNFSVDAHSRWDFSTYDTPGEFPNFLQRLRRSLVDQPHMKVFVGAGYYDLRTPFGAAEYSLDHLELPASYQENFQVEYYPAGHGFVFHLESLKKLKADLTKFYAQ